MRVFTPGELSYHTGSKYLGVLVAAKYARNLNELRRGQILDEDVEIAQPQQREKLTTIALQATAAGDLSFRLEERLRAGM